MDKATKLMILKSFGKKLNTIRTEKNISYRKLAQLCDVDHSQIGKIEKGQVSIQITTVFELSKGLGVHPKDLFDFEFTIED